MNVDDATANLLGALCLVVADETRDRVTAACGQPGSAPAALSALDQFLGRPSLDRLARVLALTPSGAVRLVDRLAEAGLVTRGPGPDGRTRSVALTGAGRRTAAGVTAARADYLRQLIGSLSRPERRTLHALLGKLMAAVVDAKDGGPWICRLCDLGDCGLAEGLCPAANAAAITCQQSTPQPAQPPISRSDRSGTPGSAG
ncbi:MAG TPA: MarR family transcriptional regulator [Kineosporiaceae bacterium]|nr:MarR family transcriptional regulator [Kineosporiaceae bacterium]